MKQILIFVVGYFLYQIECRVISDDIQQKDEIENEISEIETLRRSLISIVNRRTLSILKQRSQFLSRDQKEEKDPSVSSKVSKVKRSPNCIFSCLMRKILHPAQCHSYCTAG